MCEKSDRQIETKNFCDFPAREFFPNSAIYCVCTRTVAAAAAVAISIFPRTERGFSLTEKQDTALLWNVLRK